MNVNRNNTIINNLMGQTDQSDQSYKFNMDCTSMI